MIFMHIGAETLLGTALGADIISVVWILHCCSPASSPSSPLCCFEVVQLLSGILTGCMRLGAASQTCVSSICKLLYLHSTAQHSVNSLGLSQGCCEDPSPCAFIENCKSTFKETENLERAVCITVFHFYVF